MRRTRSRKTQRRYTRRRGGNGNGPSAAAGNKNKNVTPRPPVNTNATYNPEVNATRRNAMRNRMGVLPPHNAVPLNRYGQPKKSLFRVPKFALPGSKAALAAVPAPGGIAPLARQAANNKAVAFALPGSALALNGPAGAPLAHQNNRTKVKTKVMPLGSPPSPSTGF